VDRTAIVYSDEIAEYDFGADHPFRGDRFPRYMKLLKDKGLFLRPEISLLEADAADDRDLSLAHSDDYISRVEILAERGVPLSADTPLNPAIVRAARYIVGAALRAGELVAGGGFAVGQGVGGGLHHAGRDYGGGFCVFNDVAVCARALIERRGLERVMIFDTDAHAGNGTMDIFYREPRVLYISVHQDPRTIYPGTGFVDQIGAGDGEGYTVNVPLPPRADDACMRLVLERVFKPIARELRPDIIIRNGGSDPHHRDGLANLGLTFMGLRSIGMAVREATAAAGCGIVDLCCSGYNPETVAEGWLSILSGEIRADINIVDGLQESSLNPGLLKVTEGVIENLRHKLNGYWHLD